MMPTREKALELLTEAEKCNPGRGEIIAVSPPTVRRRSRRNVTI